MKLPSFPEKYFPFLVLFLLGATVLFGLYGFEVYGTREKAELDGFEVCVNASEVVVFEEITVKERAGFTVDFIEGGFPNDPLKHKEARLGVAGVQEAGVATVNSSSCTWFARCPDWSFHLCMAATLNASACSAGAYGFYMPILHVFAHPFALLGEAHWFFIGLFLFVTFATAFALKKLGGSNAVLLYFFLLPLFLFAFSVPRQLWFGRVVCGVAPFAFISALFFLLVAFRDKFDPLTKWILCAFIVLTHNYGFGLVALYVLCELLYEYWLKEYMGSEFYEVAFLVVSAGLIAGLVLGSTLSVMVAVRLMGLSYFFMAVALANSGVFK